MGGSTCHIYFMINKNEVANYFSAEKLACIKLSLNDLSSERLWRYTVERF